ncbi:anti-sigma factor family protein [Streptomyces lushanensis]|uniref:anti-sigma factor family protein n=1 Tax=Streptomyces lushanensis TaxID=1434255 RepID=UPI00082A40CD|nr:zf-HC2 domain-containing protein [Streptomyces lushanensis]
MSGTSPTPAEQHLGDRLAALVDGELDHDARERVLAHLATCAKCKAEADAQRRLKSVFAETAPPAPSAGLLARLQGLPGGSPGDDDNTKGLFDGGRFGEGVFGVRTDGFGVRSDGIADGFGYVPAGAHARGLSGAHAGGLPSGSGFRIHEVARQEAERSPWRGRRFAFAAASAVSFAAMALGGTMPLGTAADALPRGSGNNVTPMRAPGTITPVGGESGRRQGGGGGLLPHSVDRTAADAPLGVFQTQTLSEHPFAPGILMGAVQSPLIRPADPAVQIDAVSGAGYTATPSPTQLAAPTLPGTTFSARR